MSRWIDPRKKKEEEQAAQVIKAEEPKAEPKDYSASAVGKALAEAKPKQVKVKRETETPEIDTPNLTSVYGLQTNSKGESVLDTSRMSSSTLQSMNLALNNELVTVSGQTKLGQSLSKQIASEQEKRRANAATRNEAMQTLSGLKLMGFDGQTINVNTADAATVVRGINAIADSDDRAKAAKAYKTLAETEGSRFYGQNTDGVGTFLESANLSQSDYKEQVSAYKALFYGDGKHDKEDAAAYLEARQDIENGELSAYAQSQLLNALDRIYTGVTGKGDTPKAEDAPAEEEAPNEKKQSFWEWLTGQGEKKQTAEADLPKEEKEKKPGFFAGLAGQIPAEEKSAQTEGQNVPQDVPQDVPEADTQDAPQAAQGMSPKQIEAQIVAQGGMSFEEWRASGLQNALPSVQTEQAQEESAPKMQAATAGEAAAALLSGRYDEIEGEGKDELDRMLDSSGYARQMMGTLTESDSAEIALNNRPAETIAYASIASQGQTIKTLYDAMKSDSFPEELRGDVMAQMIAWASKAEKMEEAGTLGGDTELPLMERLLTTDEQAMDELSGIYAARDELLSDKVEMRREQEQQSAQSLADAREAALRGAASEEQLSLVRENADVSDAAVYNDNGYWTRLTDVGAYFAPDADGASGFSASTVKKNLDAQGVVDTSDYESALYEQMNILLEEDTKTALALGMSLEDYYAKTGGVDTNALCERAASRISQQGAAITDEDAQALEAPFGQGVGAGYTIGAGVRTGGEQWYLDFKDSLYVGYSQGMVTRNAARLQDRYQNAYGAYGRTQYRHDIEAALASGTLDENYAAALQTVLGSAADVYQLGIDPRDFEGDFLKNSAEIRQDIATMENYMRQNATEGEFKWFGRVKSMAYNTVSAAAATATTLTTGNSFAGFTTGYSVVEFKNHFDEYLQKGYSINSAKQMAAVNTGIDAAVNIGTFDTVVGHLTGMSALTEAAKDTIIRNPAGAMKGLSAVRAFGKSFVKAFVEHEFDEVVHDEFFEGIGGNWVENGLGEIYRRIDAGEDIRFTDGLKLALNLINPKTFDALGAAQGVGENAVENAIGAVLFSLSGAIGSGVGSLKGVRAAQDLMSGKRTDVEGVLTDVRETLGDEQAAALLDQYAEQQKEAKAVAEEVVSGKSKNGSAEQAAKAKQQAEEAGAQAEAAQTAADNAHTQFTEAAQAVADGDLTRQKEMAQARVREGENQKTANEQGAVAERRKAEMEQAAADRLEEARQAAAQTLQREDAANREAIANDRAARTAAIDEDMAALEQQEKAAEEEFYAAAESYNQARDMGLDEDTLSQLDARMEDIGAKLTALYERKEALQNPEVYAARKEAEAAQAEQEKQEQAQTARYYEREQVQQELNEITPVLRDVVGSSAKRIYLNEQQVGEVLHATGLRNISQVNREYGTKFRIGQKSADTDLDSGFFAELAAQIPGRTDAESGHPEEEIMRLIERQRELKGKLGEMDGAYSVGAVGEDAGQEGTDRGGLKNPVFQKFSSVIGKHFGTEIVVANLGDGLRGHYDPQTNRLFISSRMGTGEAMRVVLCHELTHFIEGSRGYDGYSEAALQAAYHGSETDMRHDIERITEVYAPAYERDGRTFTQEDARKELVARATETVIGKLADWTKTGGETQIYDLLGEKQRFGIRLYNKLTQFIARTKAKAAGKLDEYNDLVKARDALRGALRDAGKTEKNERRQYALDLEQDGHYDYSKSFAEQVEDWQNGKFPKNDALLIGRTPEIFRRIGLNDLPMTMNQKHVDYAVNGTKEDHQMSMVMLEHLPELLEHPVAIIESATHPEDSIVAIVDGTINGQEVFAPITIQTSSMMNGVQIDANHLASVYGKKNASNLLEKAMQKENADGVGVYYLDKKRATNLFSDPGVQFPSISEQDGLIHSIHEAGSPVKQKNLEQTETRQFKRWFGDSKVVDEDGKPLIVYHGSDADFNAFDMSKGRANMDIQGAFFSPWELDASGYGGNVRAFYLSIKNPADEGTAYRALNKFKGQNNAGVKAREYLERLGYDGVNNSGEEYIAFHPEQIKSADRNVGSFDPQNPDVRYALVLNQFDNVNAQKIDALSDRIKKMLLGGAHEQQVNREQVERANARYDREGADAMIADLATREMWTADETVAAQVAMLRSEDEGHLVQASQIAQMYSDRRSKAGQALQAGQVFAKLTASGAMAETIDRADKVNSQKGLAEGSIPVGDSAPVKHWQARQQKAQSDVDAAARGEGTADGTISKPAPDKVVNTYETAERVQQAAESAENSDAVSDANPWHIPLSGAQMALIDQYGLRNTKLPGYNYFRASVKERMLAAIIATPNNSRGDGLLTLCQQLEFMKRGYAVVTEADLNYITGEMASYQLIEGGSDMPQTPEGKTIIQRLYSAQANTQQNSAWEKFNNFGYDNMLSGSKTWSKNVMSNVLTRPLELTSEAIATVADRKIAKKTGNRTTGLISKEGRQAGQAAWAGEIANTLTDYIIRGVDTGHSSSFDMNNNRRTYQSSFMQAYHDMVAMAMQMGDRGFYEQNYQEELDMITRLRTKIQDTRETADGNREVYLRDMTEEERHAEATARATERVFQEDNAIIDCINNMKQGNAGADLAITALMPFLKTPTNVAIRAMQYSPVGLAYAVVKNGLIDARTDGGANFDQRKFVMNLGRGLTGTGLMAVGMALSGMGLIKKGREDEDDTKLAAIEKSEGRSYGMYFDLGGTQIPVDFAFPAVSPLVIGAEIADSLKAYEGDGAALAADMVKNMTASSIDQLFDNSMLSGVADLFRGYKDGAQFATGVVEGVFENTASRITPATIRALAKFTDPYARDTKSQNYVRQVLNQTIIQNWPILRQTLPTAKTITGEAQTQTGAHSWNKENQNAALHFLDSFITPWTAGSETKDARLDELVDIANRNDDTSWLPGQMIASNKYEATVTKTLAKELKIGKVGFNQYESVKIHLTDEEKRWVNDTYADTLWNGSGQIKGLSAQMASSSWARMSDAKKMEAVRDAQSKAKKAVLTELVRRKKEAGEIQ